MFIKPASKRVLLRNELFEQLKHLGRFVSHWCGRGKINRVCSSTDFGQSVVHRARTWCIAVFEIEIMLRFLGRSCFADAAIMRLIHDNHKSAMTCLDGLSILRNVRWYDFPRDALLVMKMPGLASWKICVQDCKRGSIDPNTLASRRHVPFTCFGQTISKVPPKRWISVNAEISAAYVLPMPPS